MSLYENASCPYYHLLRPRSSCCAPHDPSPFDDHAERRHYVVPSQED